MSHGEEEQGDDPWGAVDLIDDSYISTLSSLWQLAAISRGFTGTGKGTGTGTGTGIGLFKTFVRDLMKHPIKYVVVEHGSNSMRLGKASDHESKVSKIMCI